MNVRLAVRDNEHFVAGQMVVESGLERCRLPAHLAFVFHALVRLKMVDERTEVFGHRLQLGTMVLVFDECDQPLAPQH